MLADDRKAETYYREAIERLGNTRIAVQLARAHLLYGEWLRRCNRRVDARTQLHTAHEMFTRMGAEGFAERARRELLVTGQKVSKRSTAPVSELTAQEAQIAKLAGDGLTNPEIAAQLFISTHTVEWHLRKVFAKLGIKSRRQLRNTAPGLDYGLSRVRPARRPGHADESVHRELERRGNEDLGNRRQRTHRIAGGRQPHRAGTRSRLGVAELRGQQP